jgi:hypothetical protein
MDIHEVEARDSSNDLPRVELQYSLMEAIAIGEQQIGNGETLTHHEAKQRLMPRLSATSAS